MKKRYRRSNVWGGGSYNNYVEDMVDVLTDEPFLTEKDLVWRAFGENLRKKHSDMLRRGLRKGIIARVEAPVMGRLAKFYYFVPRK